MGASLNGPWTGTTRSRLLVLVAAILLPLAIFSLILYAHLARTEEAHYPVDAEMVAQTLSLTVDQELVALTAAAETLAMSHSLQLGGDLEIFRGNAQAVLAQRGDAVQVRGPDGTPLFDAATPAGTPAATPDPELLTTDHTVLATAAPAISNLFVNRSDHRPQVAIVVPVKRRGTTVATLSVVLNPVRLADMLAHAARRDWIISIVDRADRIVARSRQAEKYVGRIATDDLRRETMGAAGTWMGRTLEGTPVLGAYVRSPISGWRTAVGVPLSTVDAPLRRFTWFIALSGLMVVTLALAMALLIARTISRPITRLARQAERLGRGEKVLPTRTGLVEVDEVATALVRAEGAIGQRGAALKASEARFRAAVAAIAGVIWTNDASGQMSGDQPGWSALTGQTYDDYHGYGWASVIHPDDVEPSIRAWKQAVADRSTFIFEHRVRRRDGVYRRFSIRAIPNLGEDGEPIEWVGVHTDITDEFESRQLLSAQEAELRDLNATLERRVGETSAERDRIWQISTELMLVAQFDATIVSVNPSWTVNLGWSEAELRGSTFCALLHPDDVVSTQRELRRLERGASVHHFENRLRHRDGSYRWLSWTAVPEAGMVHAIAREVTAEKEAADALRRTEEQLRQSQKMEVVGQLTGGIAHDFNNLLTVVSGHLEMALRRVERTDEIARLERHLHSALDGARRAATLTHRLLAFSRQSALRPEPLDLNAVVAGMTEMIRRALGEMVRIETSFDPALWPVTADINQIENTILNLCVNSRDAMTTGGTLRIETTNVELEATSTLVARCDLPAGAYAVISVQDTGHGIPEELQSRVFEPFFTTKPVGKGTGLGLSQVFGFMRQSGGSAALESEVGVGTTIRLFFPRSERCAEQGRGDEPLQTSTFVGGGETCLIVEDEDMVREFSVSALEEAGYHVLAAADGAAGLKLLEAHADVELLFADIVLGGGMSGRQLAERALGQRPDLKILFTTGYTKEEGALESRLVTGAEVITKPFDAASLVSKVRALFARESADARMAG